MVKLPHQTTDSLGMKKAPTWSRKSPYVVGVWSCLAVPGEAVRGPYRALPVVPTVALLEHWVSVLVGFGAHVESFSTLLALPDVTLARY